jgi:hypothetical protein
MSNRLERFSLRYTKLSRPGKENEPDPGASTRSQAYYLHDHRMKDEVDEYGEKLGD